MEEGKWMYQGGDVDFDPQATIITEDGVRLEVAKSSPEAAEELRQEGSEELVQQLEDIQGKPDHPAFKKTAGRTFKAS